MMKLLKNNPVDSVKNESHKIASDLCHWFEDFYFPSERFEHLMLHPIVDKIDNEYKE